MVEDDIESLIDLIRVDQCTLVPLGLLRNFLERHLCQVLVCLFKQMNLGNGASRRAVFTKANNIIYRTIIEQQLTKQRPVGGSNNRVT